MYPKAAPITFSKLLQAGLLLVLTLPVCAIAVLGTCYRLCRPPHSSSPHEPGTICRRLR